MANPAEILAKIERAEESIANLNAEAKAFFASNPAPCRIETAHEPDGSAYVWKFLQDQPVPLRFAVLTGEIVHHLRSTLDYAICAMVAERGNTPSKNNHFPIAMSAEEFKLRCNGGAIKGVSSAAARIIEREQPYMRSDAPNSFLAILKNLDDLNKHQLLPVVGSAALFKDYSFNFVVTVGAEHEPGWGQEGPLGQGAKHGEVVLRLWFKGMQAEPKPKVTFTYQIAFEKVGTVSMHPVIPLLTQAMGMVRRIIGEMGEVNARRIAHASSPPNAQDGGR